MWVLLEFPQRDLPSVCKGVEAVRAMVGGVMVDGCVLSLATFYYTF
jgi:hypothetical protein